MAVQKVGNVKNKTKTKSAQQQDGHTYIHAFRGLASYVARECVCVWVRERVFYTARGPQRYIFLLELVLKTKRKRTFLRANF